MKAGDRLGPYEVLGKLGEGGMGEVYRATDTKLKRGVAIKVLPAAMSSNVERLARFQRGAELLAFHLTRTLVRCERRAGAIAADPESER